MRDTLSTINSSSLAERMEQRILTGELRPGSRLPSTRDLSAQLGVAPGTIAKAYKLLKDRGLLLATQGRGTYVAGNTVRGLLGHSGPSPLARDIQDKFSRASLASRWLFEARAADGIQLMGGYGDVSKNLGSSLSNHIERHGIGDRSTIARLHPAEGAQESREAIATRLGSMMGRLLVADEILVSHGAHALLDMALRALTKPGDTIVTEHPTYYGALDLFEAHQLNVVTVSRNQDGIDLSALEFAFESRSPTLFYCTGSPSTPCGSNFEEPERREIIKLLDRWHVTAIEDSSLWPFQFGERKTPLFADDESGNVIMICSFSKWFFPSLRFAVAIGRSKSFERIKLVNRGVTRISSAYPQFSVASYLASQKFEHDLESTIISYAEAAEALTGSLLSCLPGEAKVHVPAGGLSVWVEMPDAIDPQKLYAECTRQGVYPLIGTVFQWRNKGLGGARLSYSQNDPCDLSEAARRFGKAIQTVMLSGSERRQIFSDAMP